MIKIISFASQYRNGKDSAADYLVKRLDEITEEVWLRSSIAYHVKKIFMDTWGVSWDFVEYWKTIPEPPPGFDQPVRDALVFIGDGFRKIDKDIWIRKTLESMKYNTALSDVRYINEAKAFQNKGGYNVLLWRPNYENTYNSASEQELMPFVEEMKAFEDCPISKEHIPFNFWLRNDGTLNDLYNKIDTILIPDILRHYDRDRNCIPTCRDTRTELG